MSSRDTLCALIRGGNCVLWMRQPTVGSSPTTACILLYSSMYVVQRLVMRQAPFPPEVYKVPSSVARETAVRVRI